MISQRRGTAHRLFRPALAALFALLALSLSARGASSLPHPAPPQSPPAGESLLPVFELHSGFWLNLHHFLYLQARLADGNLSQAGSRNPTPVSLAGLTPAETRAWQAAVEYYRRDLATRELTNSQMEIIHTRLAQLETCADLAGKSAPACTSGLAAQLVDALDGAAPVYRNHWWAGQDRANRDWIAGVTPMIQQMGEELSGELAEVYEKLWPQEKIRVDVVWYAGADAAYAYASADPLRLTISSSDSRNQGLYGFEVLFHEASYAVAGPLNEAIAREFRERDKPIPRDLPQALLFYTTSEIIQRDIDAGTLRPDSTLKDAVSRYQPYGERFGLYAGAWRQFRGLLDLYWRPYLDGRVTFESAVAQMAAAQ